MKFLIKIKNYFIKNSYKTIIYRLPAAIWKGPKFKKPGSFSRVIFVIGTVYAYFDVSLIVTSVKLDKTAVIEPKVEVIYGIEVKKPNIYPVKVEQTSN